MLGWFRALMPKEERFFELFARHSQVTLAGAQALRGLLNGGDDVLRQCKEIGAREAEADEITREVLTALRRLPPRQREAVVLRYYLDMTEDQTATAMGVSRGTVKSATSRGLAALGRLLRGEAS